jgi:hypothetical protein
MWWQVSSQLVPGLLSLPPSDFFLSEPGICENGSVLLVDVVDERRQFGQRLSQTIELQCLHGCQSLVWDFRSEVVCDMTPYS